MNSVSAMRITPQAKSINFRGGVSFKYPGFRDLFISNAENIVQVDRLPISGIKIFGTKLIDRLLGEVELPVKFEVAKIIVNAAKKAKQGKIFILNASIPIVDAMKKSLSV